MLKVLSDIDFRFIWPGNWELRSFGDDKWHEIKAKLESSSFTVDDLEGTSLEDEDWIWESVNDADDVCELLVGLKNMPDKLGETFYCVSTFDGYDFFGSYEDFRIAVERDDCDYTWEELSDDVLKLWIERLNAGELDGDLFP